MAPFFFYQKRLCLFGHYSVFIIPPYTLYFKLFIVRKWMCGVFFEVQFTG